MFEDSVSSRLIFGDVTQNRFCKVFDNIFCLVFDFNFWNFLLFAWRDIGDFLRRFRGVYFVFENGSSLKFLDSGEMGFDLDDIVFGFFHFLSEVS